MNEDPVFTLTAESGVIIREDNVPFLKDSAQSVKRKLEKKLRNHPRFPAIVDEFIESLSEIWQDTKKFRQFLSPMEYNGNTSYFQSQETLLKLLLGIDLLQTNLLSKLLEQLPQHSGAENELEDTSILVIKQLRWIDRIIDGDKLCQKIMELIDILEENIQKELITSLPEIISDDMDYEQLAKHLVELLEECPHLTVSILDSLANLNLQSELRDSVQDRVLETLQSSELSALPVSVRFLLQSTTEKSSKNVVSGMRKTIDLGSLTFAENSNYGTLILDSIKSSIQFQAYVGNSWMKEIEESLSLEVIDIFVLLFMLEMSSKRAKIETTFRKKIRKGTINSNLMLQIFKPAFNSVLKGSIGCLLNQCSHMLGGHDIPLKKFARNLYIICFEKMDMHVRHSVIGNLVTHVGSKLESEVDCALSVLFGLAKSSPKLLHPFEVFIKGSMDYLEDFSLSDVRKLFSVLCLLGLQDKRQGLDEVHMVIRKQLSSPTVKFKHIGVLGAITMIRYLASVKDENGQEVSVAEIESFDAGNSDMSADHKELVVSLFEMLNNNTTVHSCNVLICEEFSRVFTEIILFQPVVQEIKETFTSYFEETFLCDAEEIPVKGSPIDPESVFIGISQSVLDSIGVSMQYNLNGAASAVVANTLSMVLANTPEKSTLMCPMVCLLQKCIRQLNKGSLSEIDAVLGCSFLTWDQNLLDIESLDDVPIDIRKKLCEITYNCINWLRELINAFSNQSNSKEKVVRRLHLLTDLERKLENALPFVQGWSPACLKELQDIQKAKPIKDDGVSKLRVCYREFIFESLDLLDLQSKFEVDDSDSNGSMLLNIEYVLLLISDLESKLINRLSRPPPGFGNVKKPISGNTYRNRLTPDEVLKKTIKLMPSLCRHLETSLGHYQSLVEENDGVTDSLDKPFTENVSNLVQSTFKCFESVFSSEHLSCPHMYLLLKEATRVFASRTNDHSETNLPPMNVLISQSFVYLSKFSDMLPDLNSQKSLLNLLVSFATGVQSLNGNNFIEKQANIIIQNVDENWRNDIQDPLGDLSSNQFVQILLQYLKYTTNKEISLGKLIDSFTGLVEKNTSKSWNMAIHFLKVIFTEIIEQLKLKPNSEIEEDMEPSDIAEGKLNTIERLTRLFSQCTILLKGQNQNAILTCHLKYGKQFLEAFLRCAMNHLDKNFSLHRDKVLNILKNLQNVTRPLQILCNHSKVNKIVMIAKYVPATKKAMETFLYRVKAMSEINNCREAFWLGNLKHKDINGEIVGSQVEYSSSDDENTVPNTTKRAKSKVVKKAKRFLYNNFEENGREKEKQSSESEQEISQKKTNGKESESEEDSENVCEKKKTVEEEEYGGDDDDDSDGDENEDE